MSVEQLEAASKWSRLHVLEEKVELWRIFRFTDTYGISGRQLEKLLTTPIHA